MAKVEKKRWMTWLDLDCWKWLHEIKRSTGASSSLVVSELIRREMKNKDGNFLGALGKMKLERERERWYAKKMEAEARTQEIDKKLKAEKVTEPA